MCNRYLHVGISDCSLFVVVIIEGIPTIFGMVESIPSEEEKQA